MAFVKWQSSFLLLLACAAAAVMLWTCQVRRDHDRAPFTPAPRQVRWGVPDRPLRVVAYNVYWHQKGIDRVAETIKSLRPDVVLLSEVPPADVARLAGMIDLAGADGKTHHYVAPSNPGEWAKPSTAIVSRCPLHAAHEIPNSGGRELGVMAEVVVGDVKFCVAALHLTPTLKFTPRELKNTDGHRAAELAALRRDWEGRGRPPMIVGGDFNQLPHGPNYRMMTSDFDDALRRVGQNEWTCAHSVLRTRVDYLLTTRDWNPIAGGVASSDASDHRPIWIEARRAAAIATTHRSDQIGHAN